MKSHRRVGGAGRRRTAVAMLAEVGDELLSLADQLEALQDHEWEVESLCRGWTVKDVVAHLTLSTRESLAEVVVPLLRSRGDFDLVTAVRARDRAQRFTCTELIAQLRAMAGVDRRFALSGRLDPLVDVLVHGQDIVRPLNRTRGMAVERAVPALEHVWASRFLNPRKRFDGIRFVATDATWARGHGPLELRATAGNLLLVATGRPAGLQGLHGAAVDAAATRLASSACDVAEQRTSLRFSLSGDRSRRRRPG